MSRGNRSGMGACYHAAPRAAARLVSQLGMLLALGHCSANHPRFEAVPARQVIPPLEARKPSPRAKSAWDVLREPARLTLLTPQPLPAPGHLDGRYRAVLRISPGSATAYLQGSAGVELPEGTLIAEFLLDARSNEPGPVFAMLKTGKSNWQFAVAEPDGTLIDDSDVSLCRRCHSEAARDSVFGPARAPELTPTTQRK